MRDAERGLTSLGGPPPDIASGAPPAAEAPRPAAPLPRILCVDDEPAVLKVLTRALERDFEIVTANDPMKALVLLEHGMDFSVVISDMRMPQMDGAEFLSRVRRIAPNSTRLALTACLERELPAEEVFGILTKPCPINLLHASVHAAVEHHVMRTLLARTDNTLVPEPQRIDRLGGPRPLDRDPRLRPQLPEIEFDPWHVARVMGASARGTTPPLTTTASTMTAGTEAATGAGTGADSEAPRLSMLAGVAEKFFRLGHAREAERILRPALWDFLQRCEGNRRSIESGIERHAPRRVESHAAGYGGSYAESYAENQGEREIELAGRLAVRLATDTNSVQWIDYLFRLFTAVGRPLSPDLIEQLHDLIRRTPGVSRNGFLRYLGALRASRHEFGPGEHFLIRRIEGLEPLLGQ
jgi:CheY-like chemotaxis protein